MSKTLIAYFSASGVTAQAAKEMADAVGADLYEIRPEQPYTSADLDWMDKNSRSTLEMNDPASRPAIAEPVQDMGQYDTVLVGFPIWWYVEPRIVDTFLESYDFPEDDDRLCHLRRQRHRKGGEEHAGPLPQGKLEERAASERLRRRGLGETYSERMKRQLCSIICF